jgi:hypothetical protein
MKVVLQRPLVRPLLLLFGLALAWSVGLHL